MHMNELTNEEINKAFRHWVIKSDRLKKDQSLEPFLSDQIKSWTSGKDSCLKNARLALSLSASTVAKTLKVSSATYSDYEKCEECGVITLATLSRVAAAMDCELVYAIRPKSKKYFSQIIWEQALPIALEHPWLKKCDQKKRSAALLYIVGKLIINTEFRKEQGWSQRKNK